MEPTVLLVDDDESVLHGLARLLRDQPYRLLTARSAGEAMEILKAHPVHVIVSDECMPGISGSDLIAWVARKLPDVTRIVLTGHATAQTAIRAINEGSVYRYFMKPCDVVELALTIRSALERGEPAETHPT
jgi:two-component system, probable response regulator PhcQ